MFDICLRNRAVNSNYVTLGDSVAEWLACWTQVQKGPGSNRSRSLRQTVHTQAAKLVAALLRVAG